MYPFAWTLLASLIVLAGHADVAVAPFPPEHAYHWLNPWIEPWLVHSISFNNANYVSNKDLVNKLNLRVRDCILPLSPRRWVHLSKGEQEKIYGHWEKVEPLLISVADRVAAKKEFIQNKLGEIALKRKLRKQAKEDKKEKRRGRSRHLRLWKE